MRTKENPVLNQFSPEQRLVVRCAQTAIEDPDSLHIAVTEITDWDGFLNEVRNHGVAQLAYRVLSEHCGTDTPDWVLEQLRARSMKTNQRNLGYTSELIDVLSTIEASGHRVIPYRGPVLASLGYGDISLREFGDIDLLVDRESIPEIKAILREEGYEPQYWLPSTETLTPAQERVYTRFCRDYPFYNPDTDVEIELHWRVVSIHFPTSITLDSVWDRRETEQIAGNEIAVLSMEDRLLMLCVHGSRHHWERLQWIADIAEVLRRNDVDWTAVMDLAREHNCQRMVALGPLLAHDLFETPLPDPVADILDRDPKLNQQRTERIRYLFDSDYPRNFATQRTQAKMLEGWHDKASFWLRWALVPDRPSIERVSLPYPLLMCYPLIRLYRLTSMAVHRSIGKQEPATSGKQ